MTVFDIQAACEMENEGLGADVLYRLIEGKPMQFLANGFAVMTADGHRVEVLTEGGKRVAVVR